MTFTLCAQCYQSGSSHPHFTLWLSDATERAAGQTTMTCQSGVLQTYRSTSCHQMHLSKRGDERAGCLALKFKVTPCDYDSSLPRHGNRRKTRGERKNKGNLLTFSSTRTHTHTPRPSTHIQCPKDPFINTFIMVTDDKALLVSLTGYNYESTKQNTVMILLLYSNERWYWSEKCRVCPEAGADSLKS